MEFVLAVTVGGIFAAGLYMMMRRSVVKIFIGLTLLGYASNLLIFTVGRLTRGRAALIGPEEHALIPPYPDPLPQALILTAIVIGFGVQAFALVLLRRAYQTVGSDDLDQMHITDDP